MELGFEPTQFFPGPVKLTLQSIGIDPCWLGLDHVPILQPITVSWLECYDWPGLGHYYSWTEGKFNATGLRIDERCVFPKESQRENGFWTK